MAPFILAAASDTPVYASSSGRLWIGSYPTDVVEVIAACVAEDCKNQGLLVGSISLKKEVCIFRPVKSIQSGERPFELVLKHVLQKRPSAISIAQDPVRIIVADTTGDVFSFLVPMTEETTNRTSHACLPLLAHFSLVTDCRARGALIATCDRDNRIRVSRLSRPSVIEAMLLVHKDLVSSICWISDSRLLSGSADCSVCLWDVTQNLFAPLHQVFVSEAQASRPMVLCVDVYPLDRDFVVVVTENDPALRIYSGALQGNALNLVSEFRPDGENSVTGAVFDREGFIWISTGGDRAIRKYTVDVIERKQFTLKPMDWKMNSSESKDDANRKNSDVSQVRPIWLTQLRKNPIVSDWKGKKRKAASSL